MLITQTQIAEALKPAQSRTIEEWYLSSFPVVAAFIKKMGGSLEDAKDVFQDAALIMLEKLEDDNFMLRQSEESYIVGTSKQLWFRKFNKEIAGFSISEDLEFINIPEDFFPSVNSLRLLDLLEKSGRKCMEFLSGFYYDKISLGELSEKLGFSTVRSATVQKYKCIEKIKEVIKTKKMVYEDFFE